LGGTTIIQYFSLLGKANNHSACLRVDNVTDRHRRKPRQPDLRATWN